MSKIESREIRPIETKWRRMGRLFPGVNAVPYLEMLEQYEPPSMLGQPPVVWANAQGCQVTDVDGNKYIDWTSGVLVTNAGHGHPKIRAALVDQALNGALHTYCFAHHGRAALVQELCRHSPIHDSRVFLVSTGSEATEACIKLAKWYSMTAAKRREKCRIVSFGDSFHGRTMGAQLAGGMDRLKLWIGDLDPSFVQVPFPDGYRNKDTSFGLFECTLAEKGVLPDDIAGVIFESYQGVGPDFLPVGYAQQLEAFCRRHNIVLIADEVQAGFCRTGKWFCFEHYGITPDLIACGKGITSSLPLSAVIGRADIMCVAPRGSMSSTHSASPLPVAAALANITIMEEEKLAERAAELGESLLIPRLREVQQRHSSVLGCLQAKGMVAGIQVVEAGTETPNPKLARDIVWKCCEKGLLLFAPVGTVGQCVKICPPLTTPREALEEGLQVFAEAVEEVLANS